MIDRDEFIRMLKREQGSLSDSQFANHIGVSPQYMSDVYLGRRDPGEKIAEFFGYEPVRAYKLKKKNGRAQ